MDVLCIVGPTAVGKTRMSIELAKALNGEIISGDSMQIYRGMDIGTAKATLEERQGIVHHLIDEKNPDEPYSVAAFQQTVRAKIEEIKSRGKLPIIVGGTGLYIKSVLYDYEFAGESESKEVDEMKYGHLSNEELHAKLAEIDEAGAKAIHPNNRKRVIRALEIYETSGIKKSEMIEKQEHKLIYDVCLIGLTDDRKVLYDRINQRVDKMYETGLVEEVEALFKQGIPADAQSIRAIGYKELYDYFNGLISLEESKELIKRNSRRYAKRQYTWFNNQMDVVWFDVDVKHFDVTIQEVLN
ncbi:MAG: tRNA (adenosine(37)-N6)-dimethylallyltransferase MiaA, partial [Turicibacter sp.]|nr:tRNA (adenosine(37)-N6)-dimethylallyltransferase MiaA [Turicibacter sp.]